jgi:hypothetical protein
VLDCQITYTVFLNTEKHNGMPHLKIVLNKNWLKALHNRHDIRTELKCGSIAVSALCGRAMRSEDSIRNCVMALDDRRNWLGTSPIVVFGFSGSVTIVPTAVPQSQEDGANDDAWGLTPFRIFCFLSDPSCQRHSSCRQQSLWCGYHHKHYNEQSG